MYIRTGNLTFSLVTNQMQIHSNYNQLLWCIAIVKKIIILIINYIEFQQVFSQVLCVYL